MSTSPQVYDAVKKQVDNQLVRWLDSLPENHWTRRFDDPKYKEEILEQRNQITAAFFNSMRFQSATLFHAKQFSAEEKNLLVDSQDELDGQFRHWRRFRVPVAEIHMPESMTSEMYEEMMLKIIYLFCLDYITDFNSAFEGENNHGQTTKEDQA